MNLDAGTISIIQLAWSRLLGLGDHALAQAAPRITKADEDSCELTFVQLFGASVLVGPAWALDAAAGLSDGELADQGHLLRLTREHGGRGLGVSALYFAEESLEVVASESTVVSFDRRHSTQLEQLCPPDDVAEVGLSGLEHQFVLLTEEDHIPLAGAGYDIWEGILANLGVLAAPQTRRMGLGSYIGAIALEESLNDGLLPQWRTDVSNIAGRRTAETLGFIECGLQASVRLSG